MEPFDPEPLSFRDLFNDATLIDYLEQQVPDYAPEGVNDLVDDYLADLDFDELMSVYELWEDDAAFWDWFRDEFYGEQ